MQEIQSIVGNVVRVQHFSNVRPRRHEWFPSPERYELWICTPQGAEHHFVIHTRNMPARPSNLVILLVLDGEVVGLFNVTTAERVNYERTERWPQWTLLDLVVLGGVMMGSLLLIGEVAMLVGTAACTLALLYKRGLQYLRICREIDGVLHSLGETLAP